LEQTNKRESSRERERESSRERERERESERVRESQRESNRIGEKEQKSFVKLKGTGKLDQELKDAVEPLQKDGT